MKFPKLAAILTISIASLFFSTNLALAANCDDFQCNKNDPDQSAFLSCNNKKIECLQGKIKETQSQAATLNNAISILNGQIQVQQLQINSTIAQIEKLEREIDDLGTRIAGLEISLDRLSKLLAERVRSSYKVSATHSWINLLNDPSIANFARESKYLEIAQANVGEIMTKAEEQRINYDEQKDTKEEKQLEIEAQRKKLQAQQNTLNTQKADQQKLLQETKKSEAQYQAELAKTLAEAQAIQDIIAGKGSEVEAGTVNEGDRIASIISGASTCSNGTHLHFEVVSGSTYRDPARFLKPISAIWNNTPDGQFSFGGDANWEWPVDNPAKLNQGYGMTYYARIGRYGGSQHTGIDIASKDQNLNVKAVRSGTLYRGSVKCGGQALRYVKVDHKDDDYVTYYLHINY